MRLPLPFLLYITALGLFGWAGWTVYEMLPLWSRDVRDAASSRGIERGRELLFDGKGKGPATADWSYGNDWWKQFTQVNLIGKLPPKVKTPAELAAEKGPVVPVVDMTPLENIFELVWLVYDGKGGGKSGKSQAIIRYKPEANVEPPEWWLRENTPPVARGTMPGDISRRPTRAPVKRPTPNRPNNRRGGRNNNNTRPPVPSTLPTSLTGREMLQKLSIGDDDNPRRTSKLWPKYGHIRFVGVASDARSAFFVRELPPAKDGEPAPEPKEYELFLTSMNLSQDLLRELRRLRGTGARTGNPSASAPAAANPWKEVENTTRFGNQFHIGRKDERQFRESADDFFNSVYVDTYVSKTSSLRGLQVRNIDPKIAQRFGVVTGDVLLEVNGRKVSNKAQAVTRVKKDYKRGVRTFSTKWLSNGQVVERVYQAPTQ